MQLYDYFVTGEGRILMACITYANDEAEVRAHGKTFDPWYANGCEIARGVARNQFTLLLWSADALFMFESLGAALDAHTWLHFNLSWTHLMGQARHG